LMLIIGVHLNKNTMVVFGLSPFRTDKQVDGGLTQMRL